MKVNIGGIEYSVELQETVPIPEEDKGKYTDLLGIIHYCEQQIIVKSGMGADQERSTVAHEVLHGVADRAGVEIEEESIGKMEVVFYMLLKDNPEFLEYVTGGRVVTKEKYDALEKRLSHEIMYLQTGGGELVADSQPLFK